MRVMMLTPDTAIDRRILQEAATLVDAWAEVLVVATQPSDRRFPEHEMLGEIKVQRFSFDGTDRRVLPWVPVRDAIARRLHAWATWAQRPFERMSVAAAARIHEAERGNGSPEPTLVRAGRYLQRIGQEILRQLGQVLSGSWSITKCTARVLLLPARLNALIVVALGQGICGIGYLSPAQFRVGILHVTRRFSVIAHRGLGFFLPGFLRVFQFFLRLWSHASSWLTGLSPYEYALYQTLCTYPYDAYHAHDLPMLKVALRLARRWKAKLVYDAHELYPEIITLTPRQRRQLTRLERRFIRHAHAVITVNRFIAEEMARRYAVPAPQVILNCAPLPVEEEVRHSRLFHERLNLAPDRVIVLYQGWLAPHRGLEALVCSARSVTPSVAIVLLGFGEYWSDLERLIATEGVSNRVFLVPAVPQDELLRWTAAADVGIIPYQAVDTNTLYCSPNKLFEYIVAGVPVIANDLPFLRGVISDHQIGITHPLSTPASYSEAINYLAVAKEKRITYQANTRMAAKLLNWDVEGRKLLEIYRGLNLK